METDARAIWDKAIRKRLFYELGAKNKPQDVLSENAEIPIDSPYRNPNTGIQAGRSTFKGRLPNR